MLLTTVFNAANVDSAAFPIALVTLHVVAVIDLLSVRGVCGQLQLGPRQEGGGVGLSTLATLFVLVAFALVGGSFAGSECT